MTRRARVGTRRTLQRTVERALHPRLLGSAEAADSGTSPAAPIQDLFPQELEAALDRTVAEFHARPRDAHASTRRLMTAAMPSRTPRKV